MKIHFFRQIKFLANRYVSTKFQYLCQGSEIHSAKVENIVFILTRENLMKI